MGVYACVHVQCMSCLLCTAMTGHGEGPMVLWDFEYGPDYSGPGYNESS